LYPLSSVVSEEAILLHHLALIAVVWLRSRSGGDTPDQFNSLLLVRWLNGNLDMRRLGAIRILLALGALALTSCSWFTDFAVVNRTADPVQVTYLLQRADVPPLGRIRVGSLGDSRIKWLPLDSTAYSVSSGGRLVQAVIEPGTALRIWTVVNYGGGEAEDGREFSVIDLEVAHSGGKLHYKGREVSSAFQKLSRKLYVLEVRP
jgi:hypothetical protein